MDWALILLKNSCTPDLKENINLRYEGLPTHFKGPVTYLWILFDELFATTSDQIQSLKSFFTYFESKGLRKYPGEAVPRAHIPVLAAARRLWSKNQLEPAQVKCVLKGFTKCSVPNFVKVFDNMWVQYEQACSAPGARFISPFGMATPFHDITHIFNLGLSMHKNMTGLGTWNVPKGRVNVAGSEQPTCWNCNKPGCTPSKCKQPKDQARIDKNRKEYFEKKNREKNSNGSNGGKGSKKKGGDPKGAKAGSGGGKSGGSDREQGNYSRSKWGTPTGGEANNIRYSDDGIPHSYCATCRKNEIGDRNGWNTSHPTKYHQEAQKPNWSVQTLAAIDPQNKLVLAVQGRGAGVGSAVQTAPTSEITITTAGVTGQAAQAIFDRYTTLASSEEVRETLKSLRTAMRLN